jgi:hypothetical protein
MCILANTTDYPEVNPSPLFFNRGLYTYSHNSSTSTTDYTQISYPSGITGIGTPSAKNWRSLDINTDGSRRVAVASDGTIIYFSSTSWVNLSISTFPTNRSRNFRKVCMGNRTNTGTFDIYLYSEYEVRKTVTIISRETSTSTTGTKRTYEQIDTNTSSNIVTGTESIVPALSSDLATIPVGQLSTTTENIISQGGYLYRTVVSGNSITLTEIDTTRRDFTDFMVRADPTTSLTRLTAVENNGSIFRWTISSVGVITSLSFPSSSPFTFSGGKWVSIDMNETGRYQVAVSNFEAFGTFTSLNENDGRIIYSEDFGDTWREVAQPPKYTETYSNNVVGNSVSDRFNYNPYNFTSVSLSGNNVIIASYGPFRDPVQSGSRWVSSNTITSFPSFPGILRITTTPA